MLSTLMQGMNIQAPSFRCTLAVLLLLLPSMITAAPAPQTADTAFHARLPLGIDAFFVRPARRNLYLFATAISPHFEGWRIAESNGRKAVLAPDGSRVQYWPATLQFRVTATFMPDDLQDVDRDFLDLNSDTNLNAYLLALRFRMKVFHGIEVTTVEPDAVDMLGMPADVPYDERIWRASFTLPQSVSIEDRIVLEVLDPQGDRLCKFHLEY